jgi:hypothetical protein
MSLPQGTYRTAAGSVVRISGKHAGVATVEFDWLEEGGCIDCEPNPMPVDGTLEWSCETCGGGSARLMPVLGCIPG